jgi:hypothetical protein
MIERFVLSTLDKISLRALSSAMRRIEVFGQETIPSLQG